MLPSTVSDQWQIRGVVDASGLGLSSNAHVHNLSYTEGESMAPTANGPILTVTATDPESRDLKL